MNSQEILTEKWITYTAQINGQFFVIENVPARVNEETGEQFLDRKSTRLNSSHVD